MTAMLIMVVLGMPPGPGPEAEAETEAEERPSPTALFDLYRKNVDGIHTLKVQWRRDQAYTEAWFLNQQATLEALATEIARLPEGADEYHGKRQEMIAQGNLIASNRLAKILFQTFLTDRTKFMLRTAPPNWMLTHKEDDWLMPDAAVTPESMSANYAGFTLTAYSGDPAAGYRTWTPQPFARAGTGMIQPVDGLYTSIQLPPLALPQKGWSGQVHPIDEFFRNDPKSLRTVGTKTIQGHETVIVELRSETPDLRSFLTEAEVKAHGTRARHFQIVRAYLDPKKGGLPWRIEWDGETLYDGKPMPRPKSSQPYRVLEVSEILELKGGVFYPAKGVDRTYGTDPKQAGVKNTIEGLLAGKVLEISTVPFEETTWNAAKVVGNEPMEETFALKFPDGVYYYNMITGMSEQSGWENRNPTKLPWAMCGLVILGWAVYGLVALTRAKLARVRRKATPASP